MKCYKCDEDKKTVKTFGKDICLACLEKRKTGRRGDSWINKSYTKTDNKKHIFAVKLKENGGILQTK